MMFKPVAKWINLIKSSIKIIKTNTTCINDIKLKFFDRHSAATFLRLRDVIRKAATMRHGAYRKNHEGASPGGYAGQSMKGSPYVKHH